MKLICKMILLSYCILFNNILYAESYKVIYKGISAGKAELTIDTNNDTYQAQLAIFPVALAKLSGIDDMIESTIGVIRNGHFYPTYYKRSDKNGNELLMVSFDNTVASIKDGESSTKRTIKKEGQDPLSQIAQIQYDLKTANVAREYTLVTEKNQRTYSVKQEGNHIILSEPSDSKRQLKLWFSSQNILTKMEKIKKGKIQFTMKKISK